MVKYRILSHTADLRLEVFGKTLEELFKNAAEAIADILHKRPKKSELHPNVPKEKIKIESINLNTLLVDFLNEILAKSQINKAVYFVKKINIRTSDVPNIKNLNFRTSDVQNIELEAGLAGYKVDKFDEDIKAVTYHEVDIQQTTNGKRSTTKIWQTKLVLDI